MEKLKVSAISCLCGRQRFLNRWSVNIGLSNGLQAIYSISIIVNQMWYADCFLFLPKVGRNSLGSMHFFHKSFAKLSLRYRAHGLPQWHKFNVIFKTLRSFIVDHAERAFLGNANKSWKRFWRKLVVCDEFRTHFFVFYFSEFL